MSAPGTSGMSAGLAEYLKRAFLYRWNLLLLLGGTGAAVLSPWPDASLALVAAAELVYLTQLVSSNKFRDAIDADVHKQVRETAAASGQRSVQELVAELSPAAKTRFEALRARCLEMRVIAQRVRGHAGEHAGEDLSASALDRLLWVFLRLLVSQEALSRFLQRADVQEITRLLDEAKTRLASQQGADERIVRSLADNVAAQELRLTNYQKAESNAEFVRIELDRIEARIHALTEAAVNRQDPDFLSGQIDSVSESMQVTEKAITEMQHITGLIDQMQEPPAILDADLQKVTQR
jgi:hypothetical protein